MAKAYPSEHQEAGIYKQTGKKAAEKKSSKGKGRVGEFNKGSGDKR